MKHLHWVGTWRVLTGFLNGLMSQVIETRGSICKSVCLGSLYQSRLLRSLQIIHMKTYGESPRLYYYFWTRASTIIIILNVDLPSG